MTCSNNDKAQKALFSEEELVPWKQEWQNMPDYIIEDLSPRYQVLVSFLCEADLADFGELIGQKIKASKGRYVRSIWYPDQEIGHMVNKRYIDAAEIPDIHTD